ncbi:MAG: hypothetical protein K0R57_5315 [Paenibacillaceae bacterium]|jgi:hypothetical protein|nr:hypothetical protein [Paenibacillaceae bacterium]
MLMPKNRICIAAAALALAVTVSGCSKDKGQAKELMEQALAKQPEMTAYSFAGSANLNIDLPAPQGANLLTGTLMGLFTQANLEWNGAASTSPVRLEADLKSTPQGSSTPIELPIMIKDNKLYLHIPLLSKQDEFYSLDMTELAGLSGQSNPVSAESLNNLTKAVSGAMQLLISDMDAKWFKEADSATLQDGTKLKTYRLEITDKNRSGVEAAVKNKLPQLAGLFSSTGLLNSEGSAWTKAAEGLVLQAPGAITVSVDEAGYIREQSIKLVCTVAGTDGKSRPASIDLKQTYNDVNNNPKFNKEVPANARSLADILKLFMPSSGKK